MGRYQGKRSEPSPERKNWLAEGKAFFVRHKRGALAAGIVVGVLAAVAAAGAIWWVTNVKAPDIPPVEFGKEDGEITPSPGQDGEEENGLGSLVEGIDVQEELPDYISDQKEGVYTFLLIGRTTMDDNSDMLMLVVFDSNTGKVDACSIPRDTLINVSSGARKINLAIWSGVNYMKNWVRKTLGVYPNFYVMVDWEGIGEIVEAIGGVYFDVPCRMYYTDPTAGFTIDLEPGYQLLDGDKAMQLIRWRKNSPGYTQYATAAGFDGSDIKRTQMQQEFIVAAAKQILQLKNLPYLGSMIQVFNNNVETDLSIGNLAWFAQKALQLDSASQVTFHTLPYTGGSAYCAHTKNYQSYVTFRRSALVELVNESLNPYNSRISLGDLDLMQINSDGTLSSSTGTVADTAHNQLISDVNAGLAQMVKDDWGRITVVYPEEDPEETDPENPDAENPDTENPDVENPDAENPDGTNPEDPDVTDPSHSGETPENPDPGEETPDAETGADTQTNVPAEPETDPAEPKNP